MWQLDSEATNASSGSTLAGFDSGARTTAGDDDAGTVSPPSKLQVCSREYLPLMYSGVAALQVMVALCCDMPDHLPRPKVTIDRAEATILHDVGARAGATEML